MRWFEIVARVCKFFGLYRLILDRAGKQPYLHRYYLINTRWLARWFPNLSYRVVLHNCVLSDEDGLHDHPWWWASKILAGGYYETMPGDDGTIRIWRGPEHGWRTFGAYQYHRLELPHEGASCWSLFVMGPKNTKDHQIPWGFQDREGNWVHWKEYIENREQYV